MKELHKHPKVIQAERLRQESVRRHESRARRETESAPESRNATAVIGASAIALAAGAGFMLLAEKSNDIKNGGSAIERFEDPTQETILIEEGANVRSEPTVIRPRDGQTSNILAVPKSAVEYSGKTYTFRNEDGKWYGVPQEAVGVTTDNDGVVWINEQRAEKID